MSVAKTHALNRTSPKGKGMPFFGTCMNCGRKDLPIEAVHWECDNPRGATQDENLIEAIEGPKPLPAPPTTEPGE